MIKNKISHSSALPLAQSRATGQPLQMFGSNYFMQTQLIFEEEIWKPIVGYEEAYQISSLGRVKSLPHKITMNGKHKGRFSMSKERVLKPFLVGRGYLAVSLKSTKNKEYIHRLVAESFIENINNHPTVNHKNGIKTDNTVHNLEWMSYSENNTHAWEFGLKCRVYT